MTPRHIHKFRIMVIYLAALVFTDAGVSFSQTKTTENFYSKKGVLIADSTFRISKIQLLKWKLIEDTLVKKIANTIEYPVWLLEADASQKFIYSFIVDKNGNPTDIHFEKIEDNTQWKPLTDPHTQWDTLMRKQIQQLTGVLKPLFNAKQPQARYYLPYKFETFRLKQFEYTTIVAFKISIGWINFIHSMPFVEIPNIPRKEPEIQLNSQ